MKPVIPVSAVRAELGAMRGCVGRGDGSFMRAHRNSLAVIFRRGSAIAPKSTHVNPSETFSRKTAGRRSQRSSPNRDRRWGSALDLSVCVASTSSSARRCFDQGVVVNSTLVFMWRPLPQAGRSGRLPMRRSPARRLRPPWGTPAVSARGCAATLGRTWPPNQLGTKPRAVRP